MSFDIPPGLTELLQGFTVAVLRERPPNLVQYAAEYFNKLQNKTQDSPSLLTTQLKPNEWRTGLSKQSSAATEGSDEDDDLPPEEGKNNTIINSTNSHTPYLPIYIYIILI